MLTNPAYIGIRRFNIKDGLQEVKAIWPSILDEKTFFDAQKVLLDGKKQKTGRESRYSYLLSTRISCAQCGKILIGKSTHGNSGKVEYYEHRAKHEHTLGVKPDRCQPFRVLAKKLEARVWNEVLGLLHGVNREKLFVAVRALEQNNTPDNSLERKKQEKTAIEIKIRNLAKRISELPEGVPADSLYSEIKTLSSANTRVDSEISAQKL